MSRNPGNSSKIIKRREASSPILIRERVTSTLETCRLGKKAEPSQIRNFQAKSPAGNATNSTVSQSKQVHSNKERRASAQAPATTSSLRQIRANVSFQDVVRVSSKRMAISPTANGSARESTRRMTQRFKESRKCRPN